MKRLVALLLLSAIFLSLAYSDRIEYEYEPYEEEEFPVWSHELRRAESLFFGSLVLTYPAAMCIYSLAGRAGADIPGGVTRVLQQAGVAAGLSLVIVGVDWILGRAGK